MAILSPKPSFTFLDVIFALFLLGMFALNRTFAYLHLSIGRVPIYITEIILIVLIFKTILPFPFRKIKTVKTPLDIPFLFYYLLGMVALARGLSTYGLDAVRHSAIVYYSLFYYLITENVKRFDQIKKIVILFFIGSFLSTVFYISGLMLGIEAIGYISSLSRAIGYNVCIIFPMLLLVSLHSHLNHNKIFSFYFLLLPIQFAAIIIGRVSSGWVSLSGSLIFLYVLGERRIKSSIIVGCVSALLCLAVILPIYNNYYHKGILDEIYMEAESFLNYGEASTVASANARWRIQTNYFAVQNTLKKPVSGVGFGPSAGIGETIGGDKYVDFHNSYLSVAFRMGFPGIIALILINLLFYFYGIRFYRSTKNSLKRAYMIGILASHLSISLNASFFMVLQGPYMGIFYWILIGLGVALINTSKHSKTWVLKKPGYRNKTKRIENESAISSSSSSSILW